jgi:cytochrome c-type biogenesis protein CcmH/NrfG
MSKSTKFTAAELLAKAEDLLERSEHETALKFLQRAVQQEPDNVAVLDTLGEVMLELGRPEDALQIHILA